MTVMLVKPHLKFKESYNNYINELADEDRHPLTTEF
ncbi:GNAT family N-acetyltransferase, partial [Acinetobacter baumannii]